MKPDMRSSHIVFNIEQDTFKDGYHWQVVFGALIVGSGSAPSQPIAEQRAWRALGEYCQDRVSELP